MTGRVIVCGSRCWRDLRAVHDRLLRLMEEKRGLAYWLPRAR